ncbi:hypothetical protein BpHYR1_021450 [Brachionus plicatilis]|uniref:Uncharacterized protein n=1 Tax=Brachionus plicatilis TaxID=10195 RepID=A0A3M7SUR1_BRAPC|nr:hypothetical protein BpHYR1_021450 [Brachionus plicatilis]
MLHINEKNVTDILEKRRTKNSIGMDLPLTNKRKAGGSLKHESALITQPSDLIETIEAGIEEKDEEEELIQPPTKRINKASSQNIAHEKVTCKTCGGSLAGYRYTNKINKK